MVLVTSGRAVAVRDPGRYHEPMNWDPDRYQRTLAFAAAAHGEQRLPDSTLPYVVHLADVAMEVMTAVAGDASVDANLAVLCALLHDTVEDAGVTADDLRARFGEAVTRGVLALTKDATLPKAERMADSLRRIGAEPREVAMVKLADRITNLQPPPRSWTPEKVDAYREEARRILAALGPAHAGLAARLRGKIEAYGPRLA
jgi:(p)ppGpp synthase/HD superfamily hydrolase